MRLHSGSALAVSLAVTASLAAQNVKIQPTATNPYPASLYQMNDVGKSLNLTQDQITRLNKVTEDTQARYRDVYNKLGTLNDQDRFNRLQELNRQYYTDWNKGARDIFNDTQRNRYQQYIYQYGPFDAFYDTDVQRRLNLTTNQVQDLRSLWDWNNQQLQEVNRIRGMDAAKGTQAYRDYWTARQERLNKFLTADQQRSWREITGEPIAFPPGMTSP